MLFQKYGFSWSYGAFLKSRNYPVMRINMKVTDRRSDHVARELFSDSETDEMDVGSEAEMQRATTHCPNPQTDLTAGMKKAHERKGPILSVQSTLMRRST